MSYQNYKVTLTFQFPAWDEVDGIEYVMSAKSKAAAVSDARRQAQNDGHAVSGRGKYWFKAVETDEAPVSYSDVWDDCFK